MGGIRFRRVSAFDPLRTTDSQATCIANEGLAAFRLWLPVFQPTYELRAATGVAPPALTRHQSGALQMQVARIEVADLRQTLEVENFDRALVISE